MIFILVFSILNIYSLNSLDTNSTINKCVKGKILKDVVFEAGVNAGKYIEANEVANDADCGVQCCSHSQCDAAFILGSKCFLVICQSYDSCKIAQSPNSKLKPRIIFVTRQNNEGVYRSIFSDDQKFPWNPNVCPPLVALKRVTLKGGLTSGEFTDIGPMQTLEQCYNICCQKNDCDLAFMLASNCFTVNCHKYSKYPNIGCVLEPTVDSPFNPEAAHMLSRVNLNQNYEEPQEWQYPTNPPIKTTTPELKANNIQQPQIAYPYTMDNQPMPYPTQLFNPFQFGANVQYPYKVNNDKPYSQPEMPDISSAALSEPSKEIMRGYFMIDANQLSQNQFTTKASPNFDSLFTETKEESDCKFDPVYYNSSLKHGKKAGTFIKASTQVKTLDACIWACCSSKNETFVCEAVFFVSNNCYMVDCYDDKSCEKNQALSVVHNPQIVYVRPITSNKIIDTTPYVEPVKTTHLQKTSQVKFTTERKQSEILNNVDTNFIEKIDSKCLHQDILWNMTVEGASKTFAEKYTPKAFGIQSAKVIGVDIKHMKQCTNLCCEDSECDAAVLQDDKCLSVSCSKNPRACTPIIVKPDQKSTQLAFMIKNEDQIPHSFLSSKTYLMGGIALGTIVIVCLATLLTVITSKNYRKNKRKYSKPRISSSHGKSNEESNFSKSEEDQEKDRLEELLSKVSASFAKNKNRR